MLVRHRVFILQAKSRFEGTREMIQILFLIKWCHNCLAFNILWMPNCRSLYAWYSRGFVYIHNHLFITWLSRVVFFCQRFASSFISSFWIFKEVFNNFLLLKILRSKCFENITMVCFFLFNQRLYDPQSIFFFPVCTSHI